MLFKNFPFERFGDANFSGLLMISGNKQQHVRRGDENNVLS